MESKIMNVTSLYEKASGPPIQTSQVIQNNNSNNSNNSNKITYKLDKYGKIPTKVQCHPDMSFDNKHLFYKTYNELLQNGNPKLIQYAEPVGSYCSLRNPSLNVGVFQASIGLQQQPDPRLWPQALTNQAKTYAIELAKNNRLKDQGLRLCK